MTIGRTRRWIAAALAAGLSCTSFAASAQTAPVSPPPAIATAVFAGRAAMADIALSPDGSRFVELVWVNDNPRLLVFDSATLAPVKATEMRGAQDLNWIRWAGNKRILMSVSRDEKMYGIEFAAPRLHLYDLETGTTRYIWPKSLGIEGDDVIYVDPAGAYLLLSARPTLTATPRVHRFDLDPGADPDGRIVQDAVRGITQWWTDRDGVIRLGGGWRTPGKWTVLYRTSEAEDFKRVLRFDEDDERLEYWQVAGIQPGSDEGYILVAGESGRLALRKWNFRTAEPGETIYENPEWDVDYAQLNREGQPQLVQFTDDATRSHWLDPEMATLQQEFERRLPKGRVAIIDFVKGKGAVLFAGDEADPGTLYYYAFDSKRLTALGKVRPDLDPARLARPTAVTYTARDGIAIRAYLTLPKGREAKGLPLIIMPHGGPYGVRDELVYDDHVQLLANRGYAVIQPNYRGSGGYGEAFEALGDGQIGRVMQDDLDDAMDWAVAQGIADPRRVCVMGISYGGYAALWGAIRNPERYACAISYAGVTDFEAQVAYSSDFLSDKSKRKWKRKVKGEGRADLDDISPAANVARLKVPVFIAHGTKDDIVPFTQYEAFVKQARRAGVAIETLELEDEIHGFLEPANEQLWMDRLVAFLAKHNPAGAPQ